MGVQTPKISGCSPGCALAALLLAGCAAPIGAKRVPTREAYAQVQANALRTGEPSADTRAILHRYDLTARGAGDRTGRCASCTKKPSRRASEILLFALAEMSYVAGDHIRRSLKPWDERDARDYYLGSAVYAWLFLFGDATKGSAIRVSGPPALGKPVISTTTASAWRSRKERTPMGSFACRRAGADCQWARSI